MWMKSYPLKTLKFDVFYADLPIVSAEWPEDARDFESFLTPISSMFAVKSDWYSKISQNVQKLGF